MNFIMTWDLILLSVKWVMVVLVYAVLLVFLAAVRKELSLRTVGRMPRLSAATGRLKVVSPGNDPHLSAGAVLGLKPDNCLGAQADNDIMLSDTFVSAHHARLSWDGVTWWVEDLGSRNGTFVGGKACPRHVPQQVPAGLVLQVGGISLELVEA